MDDRLRPLMAPETPTPPPIPPTGADGEGFLLAYLACHEAECPACGYNVHRLTEPRCPECGRRLALRIVSAAAGYSAAWVAMLVVFGLAAGVGLLVWCVEIREGFHDIRRHGGLAVVLVYFMTNIPLPAALLALRRPFVRLPSAVQYLLLSLGAAVTFAMLTWFVVVVVD